MKKKNLLKRLDEAGNTGLDLSPGDPVCAEAAKEIRRLTRKIKRLEDEITPFGEKRYIPTPGLYMGE